MVRAKFYVGSKSEPKPTTRYNDDGTQEQVDAYDIALFAVTATSPENKSFFSNTPGGVLNLNTVNKDAADQFEVGKEYYLDFSVVGEPAE